METRKRLHPITILGTTIGMALIEFDPQDKLFQWSDVELTEEGKQFLELPAAMLDTLKIDFEEGTALLNDTLTMTPLWSILKAVKERRS